MKHVSQKGNECYIAALSMVSGRSYEGARRSTLGRLWRSSTAEGYEWWWPEAQVVMAADSGLDPRPIRGYGRGDFDGWRHDRLDGRKVRGRGVLLVVFKGMRYHAVAFEDATIYDSALAGPMPLGEWLEEDEPWKWLKMRAAS